MRHLFSYRGLNLLVKLTASFSMLIMVWLGVEPMSVADRTWAESPPAQPSGKLKGNILQGREIFNGKGVCYYCHGIDGYLSKTPRLEADTAKLITKLNPPPPIYGIRMSCT